MQITPNQIILTYGSIDHLQMKADDSGDMILLLPDICPGCLLLQVI